MGLVARLLGRRNPIPAGAQPWIDNYGPLRDHFCIRLQVDGEPTEQDQRVGPVFNTLTGAAMYRDYLSGDGPLDWNVNGVGMPV